MPLDPKPEWGCMETFEASFDVESKTDAYAVERLLNQMYDSLREESRSLREGSSDSTDMLAQFEAMAAASQRRPRGSLTVRYEVAESPEE